MCETKIENKKENFRRFQHTVQIPAMFQCLLLLLHLISTKSQCDYRPALHPATEVIFIVPDRTLGHLVDSKSWRGIENILDAHSANADTRMAIVQYGRDGRRGIVQGLTHSVEEARSSFRSSLLQQNDEQYTTKQDDQLPADQVYIDAAGLVEVMFGTLSSTVAASSKDNAVVRKGAGLGLRSHVPWHVVVLAVANAVAVPGTIFAVPSKDTPPIVLAVARAVAVPARPEVD